jgi:hypothetical protein
VTSRDRRLRKQKGEVKGQEIEERYGEVKSRDGRLRKKTGEVKGQEIEEKDG